MPAQSKQQVRLMRLVRGVQTGDTPKSKVDDKVKQMAKDMKPADVKDFAKTPESGLPEKKKQESLNEGEWSKIMKGVRKGDQSGPWALVVIDGMSKKKVIHQELVDIKDAIPAHYEDLKRKFKGDYISIEDKSGRIVYNGRLGESVKESAPEGWEKTVKAMKKHKDIDNPWALAHWMKGKGYQSKKEQVQPHSGQEDLENDPKVYKNAPIAEAEDCGCNKNEQSIHTSNKLSLKTAMNGIKTK